MKSILLLIQIIETTRLLMTSNVFDFFVVHQVCCPMHFDDGFVFIDLMMTVLEIKSEGILRIVLYEYVAN